MADIPAGTGLGSSGSFGTCLLKALHKFKRHNIHPRELAEMSCHIEIDVLKEPVGKQDPYIAAFGGVTAFEFKPDDTVVSRPVAASGDTLDLLEDSLIWCRPASTARHRRCCRSRTRRRAARIPRCSRTWTG